MPDRRLTVGTPDGRQLDVLVTGPDQGLLPLAHGAWLGAQVRGASVHLLPGEGHLTLITAQTGQVLAELASLAGLAPAGGC
jgi:hypothetical protein